MPNLYGVSNSTPLGTFTKPGGDTVCNAGVYTTFCSSTALIAPSAGFYYPVLLGTVVVGVGATPPSGIQLAFIIGSGSLVDWINLDAALYPANQIFQTGFALVGTAAEVPWRNPGSVLNVQCNPTGQNVTVRAFESRVTYLLLRAPDQ